MAVWRRRPAPGVIHHSDQAAQYTSLVFTRRPEQLGIRRSMGSAGDALNNALAETLYGTLETDLMDRKR